MSSPELILVVDDTPANLEVVCETLSDAGYEVATAINGDRALKRAQAYPPDLILLDVQMPGIDGFETCQRLKACLLYTSPSPRDQRGARMPSSA